MRIRRIYISGAFYLMLMGAVSSCNYMESSEKAKETEEIMTEPESGTHAAISPISLKMADWSSLQNNSPVKSAIIRCEYTNPFCYFNPLIEIEQQNDSTYRMRCAEVHVAAHADGSFWGNDSVIHHDWVAIPAAWWNTLDSLMLGAYFWDLGSETLGRVVFDGDSFGLEATFPPPTTNSVYPYYRPAYHGVSRHAPYPGSFRDIGEWILAIANKKFDLVNCH